MRMLAMRLLALEATAAGAARAREHEAVRVWEKLRVSLTRLAGADGYMSLLKRALALARAEAPSLRMITLKLDFTLDGFESLAAEDPEQGAEAGLAITAHLLDLLATFIGEPLTVRLVREVWPNVSLDELGVEVS